MKNTKKSALLTTAAVAGLTLVGGIQANADQVNSEANTEGQQSQASATSEQQAQARLDQAQTNVTSAQSAVDNANNEVNSAQSAFNAASDAQAKQQSNVNVASDAVNKAKDVVNQDQDKVNAAEAVAKSATPENIQKAKDAIQNQSETINNDSNAIDEAQKAESNASQALEDAKSAANAASTDVTGKQEAVNNATTGVKVASDALKGTGLAEAQDNFNSASQAADKAESDAKAQSDVVNKASDAANVAQSTASQAANKLTQANNKVSTATSTVTTKSAVASQAKEAKNSAQQAVDTTNKSISNVNEKIKGYADNSITVPQAAVNAFNSYESAFDTWYHNQTAANKATMDSAQDKMYEELYKGVELNQYKSSSSEANESVNLDNLTQEQKNEINDFAASLINSARKSWGTLNSEGHMVPTVGIQNMANEIAQKYHADNWSITKGHYVAAITQVAGENGLNDGNNYYEDAGEGFTYTLNGDSKTSLDNLKKGIYNCVVGMLFNDGGSANGHLKDLIGLKDTYNEKSSKNVYFGVGVNTLNGVTGQIHFINVEDTPVYIENESEFSSKGNKEKINYTDPRVKLENQLTELNNNLSQQQEDLTNATNADNQAQSALQEAKSALQEAKSEADEAQKVNNEAQSDLTTKEHTLETEQEKLTNLNVLLATAINNKTQAKKVLDNFNADQQTKLKAYKDAQKNLDKANDELQVAKTAESKAINKVNDAKSVLDQKTQTVKSAQAQKAHDENELANLKKNLSDLQNAPKLLANAQDQLKKDQATLDTKNLNLKKQNDLLTPLVEAATSAQKRLDTAKQNQKVANENLNKAKNELDAAVKALWTDAKKYGKVVSVKPETVTVGQNVPEPTLANKTFKEETNIAAQQLFAEFAEMPEADNAIPEGTTAKWLNAAKVQADTLTAGTYTEDVLVSFPDGTSVVVKGTLNVVPVVNGGTSSSTKLPDGYKISGNNVVDAQGHIVAGWIVRNGKAVPVTESTKSNTVGPTFTENVNGSSTSQSTNNQAQLPQTGNNKQDSALLGLLGASLLGVLGIAGKKKEY